MNEGLHLRRMAMAVLAAGTLSAGMLGGCAPFVDPSGTMDTLASVVDFGSGDRAMAALSRGEYSNAERYAMAALTRTPKDPHALLVVGLVHQSTGRFDTARQYYEVIVTNEIDGMLMSPGADGVLAPRSVLEVARANMAAVDKLTGRNTPRSVAQSGRVPVASVIGGPPLPLPDMSADPLPPAPTERMVTAPGRVTEAEANVAGRFRILKGLLNEGLITPEEYAARRAVNLGALLPYSAQPPAQGLDRPIPRDNAVIDRLRALAATLETQAISAREHAQERAVILDALLPETVRRTEMPALPPRDIIEAGAAVGRLERMLSAGLVDSDEAKRERAAIERILDASLASARVSGSATGLRHGEPTPEQAAQLKGGQGAAKDGSVWGIRLDTSPKTEAVARKAWEIFQRRYPAQLGKLDAAYVKTELPGKGTRWAVVAGPLDSNAADNLCKAMKVNRQACDRVPFKK